MTAASSSQVSDPPTAAPARPGRVPTPSMVSRARVQQAAAPPMSPRAPRTLTPLEWAGRVVRRSGLQFLVVLFALAYFAGLYAQRRGWLPLAAGGLLGLTSMLALAWRMARTSRGARVTVRTDATLALLAVQGAYAVVQVSGDLHSALYPLVYLLGAFFAVAPWPRNVSLGLVLAMVGENVLRYVCADALTSEWASLVVQTGFMAVFAILYHLILNARMRSSRIAEEQAVTERLREVEESARGLRLVVADRSRDARRPSEEDDLARRLLLGAILEVERSVGSILEGAHLALGGHALALYWLSSDEATILLRDGRCAAGLLSPGPLPAGDGILGSVLRHSQPVRQAGKLPGVNWYSRSVSVRSVAAVPVIERTADGTGFVRGVLLADRLEPTPYEEKDTTFLAEIAAQIARAVEAERLVGELHRSKDAQDRLQRAAEQLNKAATIDEVTRATAKIARELVRELNLVAVTRLETTATGVAHVVAAAEGDRAHEVDGLVYDDNDGLVANVVRLGAPQPPKAPALLERLKIFDLKLGGFGSLRVLPLNAGGRILGTIVLGSRERNVLDDEARRRLESLAALAAGALGRALALDQVAQLATTDGLTRIANRRQLDLLAERAFLQGLRHRHPIAVVMADIDHFKRVNDGYGHPAGDDVLRGFAAILQEEARTGDVVGRYGGEEFVFVLPNTDGDGAAKFVERVRARVEAATFATAGGPLHVTASFGFAAFPGDGGSLADLTAAADDALYVAKANGRNRVEKARPREQRRQGGT